MKRLATLLSLFFGALLSYELADLTWKMVLEEQDAPQSAPQPTVTAAPARPVVSTDAAIFRGLFGQAAPTAAPLKSLPREAPVTQLNLNLLGILFVASDPGAARALISTPEAKERSCAVGESVGGAVLRDIQKDQVILEHNGRLEALRLPKKELSLLAEPGMTQKVQLTPEAKALMGALWNTFQDKPESLLENMRIEPAYVNGQFAGVQLYPGKDPTFLEKFGLRTGDRVTWINGVELTDPLKGMAVLGTLGTARTLQLRVLRKEDTLSFEFQRNP